MPQPRRRDLAALLVGALAVLGTAPIPAAAEAVPAMSTVTGTVLVPATGDAAPVASAGAQVCEQAGSCTITAGDGTFALAVPGGPGAEVSICASLEGWRTRCSTAALAEDGTGASLALLLTAAIVPAAPASVQADAADSQAVVRWSAPPDDGGWAVTGYTVELAPGGASCTTDTALSTDPLSCTVHGLANGVEHTVSVVAINPVGAGAAATTVVTPAGPPGEIRSLAAAPGTSSGSAVLTWLPPEDDGGSAVVGYTATSAEGTCDVDGTSALCTGLTGGVARSFSVAARNGVGTGPSATTSGTALDADAPTASEPALLAAAGWSRTPVTVSWGWSDVGAGIDPAACTASSTSSGQGSVQIHGTCRDLVGNVGSASRSALVDTSAPTARMTSAAARLSSSMRLSLSWSGADAVSGVRSWSVRIGRVATATGAWSGWSTPSTWSVMTGTTLSFGGRLGYRYCFSVRATDHAGNRSAWSASQCAADPLRSVWIGGSYPGDDPFRIGSVGYRSLATTPYLGSSGGWYQGHPVTTGFGSARSGHPHSGTDYNTVVGEPVKSPCSGVVVRASYTWVFGKHVLLRCDSARLVLLGHLDSIRLGWAHRVSSGTVVGRSGNTGHSTGSHLHVTMWAPAGYLQDPHRWFLATGRPLFWG